MSSWWLSLTPQVIGCRLRKSCPLIVSKCAMLIRNSHISTNKKGQELLRTKKLLRRPDYKGSSQQPELTRNQVEFQIGNPRITESGALAWDDRTGCCTLMDSATLSQRSSDEVLWTSGNEIVLHSVTLSVYENWRVFLAFRLRPPEWIKLTEWLSCSENMCKARLSGLKMRLLWVKPWPQK